MAFSRDTAVHSSWHDDVIKWKHFPRYWPFMRGIHRSSVNSPHKGQWRGALMFSLICAWMNRWVNNSESGDLRRHRAHHEVIVMNLTLNQPAREYHILIVNAHDHSRPLNVKENCVASKIPNPVRNISILTYLVQINILHKWIYHLTICHQHMTHL